MAGTAYTAAWLALLALLALLPAWLTMAGTTGTAAWLALLQGWHYWHYWHCYMAGTAAWLALLHAASGTAYTATWLELHLARLSPGTENRCLLGAVATAVALVGATVADWLKLANSMMARVQHAASLAAARARCSAAG
jgi:hypothetical protein